LRGTERVAYYQAIQYLLKIAGFVLAGMDRRRLSETNNVIDDVKHMCLVLIKLLTHWDDFGLGDQRANQAYGRMFLTREAIKKDIAVLAPGNSISVEFENLQTVIDEVMKGYKECWDSGLLWTTWLENNPTTTNPSYTTRIKTGLIGMSQAWKDLARR